MTSNQIKENIEKINDSILQAEIKASRKEGSVQLCAVSKFHPAEDVIAALNANQFVFGENRVQEAYDKFNFVQDFCKTNNIQNPDLHIIGSLQSNKVKKAIEVASTIQSVDRESLLEEIEKQASKINKNIKIFFEIHTGEESKSGYENEKDLMVSLENISNGKYPHVIPVGLMTMAPFVDDEKLVRNSFIQCRNLKEKINQEFPQLNINELSMGMSGDFKIAIEEGSTMVRVGTAIFGERDYGKV